MVAVHVRSPFAGSRTTLAALLAAALTLTGAMPAALAEPGPAAVLPPMDEALAARLATSGDAVLEAIVMMEEPATKDDLLRARGHGLGITPPLRSFPDIFAVRGPASGVRAFLLDGGVAWAEWNAPLELHLDTARAASRAESVTANLQGMGGPIVVDGQVVDGTGVGVAVVDGGIDATHPDLPYGTKVKKNLNFVCTTPGLVSTATQYCFGNWDLNDGTVNQAGPSQPNICDPLWVDAPTSDHTSGHGTHVAGIVGGTGAASNGLFRGVAPGAAIYGFGAGEAISILYAIESFDWILCNHATVDPPIKVVNNSWGSPPSATGCTPPAGYDNPLGGIQRLLVDTLVARGITVVFSSGNSGGTGSPLCNSPQSRTPTAGVIGVASFNDEDRGTTDAPLSTFSSRGLSSTLRRDTWPDISGPGDLITSTMSRTGHVTNTPAFGTVEVRNPNYVIVSGTSMSAPHVAGVAALVRQVNPALTPAQVEDLLEDTAHKFNFAGGGAYFADTAYTATTSTGQLVTYPGNPGGDLSSFDKGHGLVNARAAVLAAAALAGKTPTDTPAVPLNLAGKVYYLRTGPTGLGNVDREVYAWDPAAPTKDAPSLWSDAANMLQNSDTFSIPALELQGGVSLVNTDVKVRFWASMLGGADLTNPATPPAWTVRLMVGATNLLARTGPEPLPVGTGPRMYEVTFPGVTASGTSFKVRFDSDSGLNQATPTLTRETNFGNALYYDSLRTPTSIAFGVSPPAGAGLAVDATQACIRERPGTCFPTIQAAIDASVAGEHVDATAGTFDESINVDKAVSVEAIAGSDVTTIRSNGPDPVRLTAAGAGLVGFTVANAAAGAGSALVRVEAAGANVQGNVLLATQGRGVLTTGAGGATLSGNTIGAPTGVEVAGTGAGSVQDNAIGRSGSTGLLAQAGAGPLAVSGNDFRASATHARDLGTQLTASGLLQANVFDRAVTVSSGGSLQRAVYGAVQGGVNAAPAGASVIARSATFAEAVQVPSGKDGLTLCGSSTGTSCGGGAAVLDATGVGPVALTVRSNGVTVTGWSAIRAASEPGVAVDARGTSSFTIRGASLEAGAGSPDGQALGGTLPSSFAQGPGFQDYLADSFVSATLASPAFAALRAAHAQDAGFLSAAPVPGQEPYVALVYAGAAPDAVKAALAASGGQEQGLAVRVHEHAQARQLKQPVDEAALEGMRVLEPDEVNAGPQGPLLPGPQSGLGPGSMMLITLPPNTGVGGVDTGGTFLCTANFVFRDGSGNNYLGTAGHCVLQEDAPDKTSPLYLPATQIRVCIANCVDTFPGLVAHASLGAPLIGTYVNLGTGTQVLWAQQERAGNAFGEDYSFVRIPASLAPNIRPYEPFWGGPTGTSQPTLGEPMVHYGHGLGTGETFATEGRGGVQLGGLIFGGGAWDALGWATGGDSGSAALVGEPRVGQKLVGRQALGDITHSITGVGAPLMIGTLAEHAIGRALERTGVQLFLVQEDGGLAVPPLPLPTGIDISGTTGARVEGNVILGAAAQQEAGVGVLAAGAAGATILANEVRGWRSAAVELSGGASANRLEGNILADGCEGVVLDGPGNLLTGNAISSFACDGVLVRGGQGNVLRLNVFRNSALPLTITANGVHVDARANDWQVYEWQLVRFQPTVLGDGVTVDVLPFLLESGHLEPGLVNVVAGTCAGRAALAPETSCGFLSISEAMAFAPPGASVRAPASRVADNPTPRIESVAVGQGVALCASPAGGSSCSDQRGLAIIDGSEDGGSAVSLGSGASVRGFTLQAGEGAIVADLRGSTGASLRDNAMQGGAPGTSGEGILDAVLPFSGSSALPDLQAGAPALGPKPRGAQQLARPIPADVAQAILARAEAPDGPQAPAAPLGIGPGNQLIIFRSDGAWGCTSNFVFDGSDGRKYLGAAGHCFVPEGVDDSQSPGFSQPVVMVCVRACSADDMGLQFLGDWVTLGQVPYAVQRIPDYYVVEPPLDALDDGSCAVGCDFGVVEIPAALHGSIRPWMWFWRGPSGSADAQFGDPVVHYGYGTAVGSSFPSQGRAGIAQGTVSTGEWFAWQSPSAPGDSGSAVAIGAVMPGEVLRGAEAAGILTHLIACAGDDPVCAGPAVGGTTMGRAVQLVQDATGLGLTLVEEDAGTLPPPPPAGASVGVDAGASAGARVQGNGIAVEAGLGVRAAGASGLLVLGNVFDAAEAVALSGTHSGDIEGNDFRGAGFGVTLASGTSGLAVDAELNCWNAQTLSGVRSQVRDEGTGNAVDVVPFLDSDCLTPVLPPTASFTAQPNPTTRIVDTQFRDTSAPGGRPITAWAWDFDDGATSAARDPAHRFGKLGAHKVTLTVTNGAELTSTVQQNVVVNNVKPRAGLSGPAEATRIAPAVFQDLSTDPDGSVVGWLWDFGDGVTSTGQHPMHTYAALGTFTVSLTVTDNDGDSDTATTTVTVVNLAPVPAFTVDPEVPMIFTLAHHEDGSSDADGGILGWFWEFDDGFTSTDQDVTHIYTSGGPHTVKLTVTDTDGASATLVKQVFVCDPIADLAASVDPDHVHLELRACVRVGASSLPLS